MPHVSHNQFNTLPELYDGPVPVSLEAGDILIHRAGKDQKWGNAYHASIMAYMPGGEVLLNYDSCPSHNGVSFRSMANFGDLAVVFRPNSKPDYGKAAAQVAADMTGVGYSSGLGGIGRALRIPFHSHRYTNSGTANRLLKYSERGNRPKNVVCTELCVVSYQLAIANPADPYYPRLDGKFLYPSDLESYLLKQASFWTMVGKVTGPNGHG